MKLLQFLIILIPGALILSCQSDDDLDIPIGTSTQVSAFKIITSDTTSFYMEYNRDSQLVAVRNDRQKIEFRYVYDNQGQLIEALDLNTRDGSLTRRDSFIYNQDEQIIEIIKFSSYKNDQVPSNFIRYEYHTSGQVKETIHGPWDDSSYYYRLEYEWEDGNMIREEKYDPNSTLIGITEFEYDNKINFRRRLPLFGYDEIYKSSNNMVRLTRVKTPGYIDYVCYVCLNKYKYNSLGLPVHQKTNTGREYLIEYAK